MVVLLLAGCGEARRPAPALGDVYVERNEALLFKTVLTIPAAHYARPRVRRLFYVYDCGRVGFWF